ncbi:hypothetical protein [Fusobacterium mortiferum]|jgi:hypothetical protein|uniref:hypothetical protein n=1 Tax=Fusobacterium mortiferum TaxID=850 RepID=UPI00158C6AFD|nr:hypothetical protein [Fusobacterium mortiferum]DAJ53493.1 MAG TPA: hypothetical protein [Caudoviricetes sp.]
MLYINYIKDNKNKEKIDEILFEMGLTTDLVLEGVNDKYEEGIEKLKKLGEEKLVEAIQNEEIEFFLG